MDCSGVLKGWDAAGWFYGLATEEYSTFAALMASVAAAAVFFLPETEWTKAARRLYLGAFFSLLIATTLYGEVAGNLEFAQQAVTGSAASALLAIGSAVLILTSIPFVYETGDVRWPGTAVSLVTGVVAASSLVVGVRLSRLLVFGTRVPALGWLLLVLLAAALVYVLLQVAKVDGEKTFVDAIVVSLAVLTASSFLGTAAALTIDIDHRETLAFLAMLRAAGAAIIISLAIRIARAKPWPGTESEEEAGPYPVQS